MPLNDETPSERIHALEAQVSALLNQVDALQRRLEEPAAPTGPRPEQAGAPVPAPHPAPIGAEADPWAPAPGVGPLTPPPAAPIQAPAPTGPTPRADADPRPGAPAPAPAAAPLQAPAPALPSTDAIGAATPTPKDPNSSRFVALLLSGLAALLIILAGTSLIALLWDSIADWVKILVVALAAITMTVGGALWGRIGARPSIPAATVLGIGTGLGYVAGIGAALLDMLPPIGAFLVLLVWTIATTALATLIRMPFTLIATSIGGIATLSLLAAHANTHSTEALLVEALILAYSAAALASSGIAALTLKGGVKRWTIASSAAVTAPAIAYAPTRLAAEQSTAGAYLMNAVLTVLALASLVLLVRDRERREWQWAWLLAPVIVILSCSSLIGIAGDDVERVLLALVHLALTAGLIGFAAAPSLSGPFGGVAEYALLVPALALPFVSGIENPLLSSSVKKGLLTCAAWLVILACAALATTRGSSRFLLILPILGVLKLFDFNVGAFPALFIILTLIIATVLIDLRLEGSHRERSIAVWGVVFALVLLVPEAVDDVADHTPYEELAEASTAFLFLLIAAVVLLLGVARPGIGPADLWLGRRTPLRTAVHELGADPSASRPLGAVPATTAPSAAFPAAAGIPAQGPQPAAGPGGTTTSPFTAAPVRTGPGSGGLFTPLSAMAALILVLSAAYLLPVSFPISSSRAVFEGSPFTPLDLLSPFGLLLLAIALVMGTREYAVHPLYGVLRLLVFTGLIMRAISMIRLFEDAPWVLTLAVLLVGAGAITLGFKWRAPNMRLTALFLIIGAVFKLALLDTGFNDSISRIVSLLIAGLVCFGLSLLYSRLSARAREKEAFPAPPSAVGAPSAPFPAPAPPQMPYPVSMPGPGPFAQTAAGAPVPGVHAPGAQAPAGAPAPDPRLRPSPPEAPRPGWNEPGPNPSAPGAHGPENGS